MAPKKPAKSRRSVFGKNLQDARKSAGLTQDQLAERAGVSARTLASWEAGDTGPDVEGVYTLMAVLGVGADRLYGHTERARSRSLPGVAISEDRWDLGLFRVLGGHLVEQFGEDDPVIAPAIAAVEKAVGRLSRVPEEGLGPKPEAENDNPEEKPSPEGGGRRRKKPLRH